MVISEKLTVLPQTMLITKNKDRVEAKQMRMLYY